MTKPIPRPQLKKAVSARQFFMLAYGTVVGVGWLVYPGVWLSTSGPLGAIAGFATGGVIMLVIALCYAEMAGMFRVSGGEVAYTYESRFDSPLFGRIIVFTGLLGLITTLNPIFIAASRLVFALGRARMIPAGFAAVHPAFGSPGRAVLLVGLIGALGSFLGRGGLSPIVGMAVMCLATVFFFVCLGVLILRVKRPRAPRPFRVPGGVFTAGLGVAGTLFFLAVSIYEPYANSDGFPLEWSLFIGGVLLGLFFWVIAGKVRTRVSEKDRRRLILDVD